MLFLGFKSLLVHYEIKSSIKPVPAHYYAEVIHLKKEGVAGVSAFSGDVSTS